MIRPGFAAGALGLASFAFAIGIAPAGASSLVKAINPAGAAALTLSDAVRYALSHSPAVAKQEAVLAQAHDAYVKQRAASLPPVTGMLQSLGQKSSNFQGSFAQAGLQQLSVFSQNTAQIGTEYTLNTSGYAFIQRMVAGQQYDQAKADLQKIQNQIASDVTSGFYTVAAKDETVRLDQSDAAYKHALVVIAHSKVKAGVAAGVDELQAQANEAQSRSTLVAAQADAESARDSLAQMIGAPLDTQFAIPSEVAAPLMPEQPLPLLISIAQTHRPDVTSAQDSVNVALLNRKTVYQDVYPTIQITAAFGNQFSPTSAAFVPSIEPRGAPGFWQLGATSTFALPFVDYGTHKASRENFDQQIASSRSEFDQASEQVAVEVRQAYRSAQTALAQLQYTQEEVKAGVESARVARLQYQNGLKALSDVLSAQQTALSAQMDRFNARVSYVDAIVKLRVAIGIYDAQSAVADIR
ncbi:MAG: TolC family protein [Vulcanimicrobiaceae bacterium]